LRSKIISLTCLRRWRGKLCLRADS
jgi:hypothetical protein